MEITKIIPTQIPLGSSASIPEFVAVPTEGIEIDFTFADYKTLVLIKNTTQAAIDITFAKGNSPLSGEDGVFTVGADDTVGFALESGRYKLISGEHRGCLFATPSAVGLTAAAVVMP